MVKYICAINSTAEANSIDRPLGGGVSESSPTRGEPKATMMITCPFKGLTRRMNDWMSLRTGTSIYNNCRSLKKTFKWYNKFILQRRSWESFESCFSFPWWFFNLHIIRPLESQYIIQIIQINSTNIWDLLKLLNVISNWFNQLTFE